MIASGKTAKCPRIGPSNPSSGRCRPAGTDIARPGDVAAAHQPGADVNQFQIAVELGGGELFERRLAVNIHLYPFNRFTWKGKYYPFDDVNQGGEQLTTKSMRRSILTIGMDIHANTSTVGRKMPSPASR